MSSDNVFKTLPPLPFKFNFPQCVLFNQEILICGSANTNVCYSYHLTQQRYKLICSYPEDVEIENQVVIKCKGDRNQITLFSFGGSNRVTLMMRYRSVWDEKNNRRNIWQRTFHNVIDPEDMDMPVHAVIGGSKNQLLFYVCPLGRIRVVNVHSLEQVGQGQLPINCIDGSYCLVRMYHYLLFVHTRDAFCIQYDEILSTFSYKEFPVCPDLKFVRNYSYACVKNLLMIFGGRKNHQCLDKIY
ncbi:hypothetical protein RFI_17388, partial [Reticulomyxa filosa]